MTPDRLQQVLTRTGRHKAAVVTIYQTRVDGSAGEQLGEWELESTTIEQRKEVAEQICNAVQSDCDEAGYKKTYRGVISANDKELHKFGLKQRPSPEAMEEVREERASGGGGATDPSYAGILELTMRHSERSQDLLLSSYEKTIRALQEANDRLTKENAQLRNRESEMWALLREAERVAGDPIRTQERFDRTVDLFAKAAAAAGIQIGILPQGFSFDGDVSGLKQTLLSAAKEAAAGGDESTNGAAGAAVDVPLAPEKPKPADGLPPQGKGRRIK